MQYIKISQEIWKICLFPTISSQVKVCFGTLGGLARVKTKTISSEQCGIVRFRTSVFFLWLWWTKGGICWYFIFYKSILLYKSILFFSLTTAASEFDDETDRDAICEMRKLDQDLLYDALKHENLRDHVELDEEDHEFLSKVSKGLFLFAFDRFSACWCTFYDPEKKLGNQVMFYLCLRKMFYWILFVLLTGELKELIQRFSQDEDDINDEDEMKAFKDQSENSEFHDENGN